MVPVALWNPIPRIAGDRPPERYGLFVPMPWVCLGDRQPELPPPFSKVDKKSPWEPTHTDQGLVAHLPANLADFWCWFLPPISVCQIRHFPILDSRLEDIRELM